MINLVFIPFYGLLWWIGGGKNSWARDIIIPILTGIILFFKHPFFSIFSIENIIMSITIVATCNIIRMGYGAYDPEHDDKPSLLGKITKDRNGWVARSLYGFICGFISIIPLIISAFIVKEYFHIIKYILFCVLFSFICFLVVRLKSNRLVTDLFIGSSFGIIIIL